MKSILVTSDLSPCSESAFAPAMFLRELFESKLQLLCVLEPPVGSDPAVPSTRKSRKGIEVAKLKLEDLWSKQFPGFPAKTSVIYGENSVAEEIAQFAHMSEADLIVIATHGRHGIRRLLAGSVTERLLRIADCPVLVVPPGRPMPDSQDEIFRIVVTTDFSEASFRAFPPAVKIFSALGPQHASLTLLHVSENMVAATFNQPLGGSVELIRTEIDQAAERQIMEIRDRMFAGTVAMTSVVRARGPVHEEMLAFVESHRTDLLVMASQGHSALDRAFFGSSTEKMIRFAPTSTLIVPPARG